MSIEESIGYYTYRSFRNAAAGEPNDLLWGEGEFFILITDDGAVAGTLAFPSEAGAPVKDFMDLSGSVTDWNQPALHFVGKGRPGTAIADFEYEYNCRLALEWDPSAPPQRPALVGTVRRNKDHGNAKAGATASFIAVKHDFREPRTIPGVALIPEAVQMLGERTHRMRHTVWHSIRSDWFSPNMTNADRDRLKAMGWNITDPPFNASGVFDLTNGAGEDFLYMHRRMIGMVHSVYDQAGQPRPATWKQLPGPAAPQFAYKEEADPDDPALKRFVLDAANSGFMIPPPTKIFMEQTGGSPFLRFNKTARGFGNLIRNVANSLRNPRVLSGLTLGAYGNLLEFTVHNWMHMRWATVSRIPETGELAVRDAYDVDKKWDGLENDYLGDFHSSHVNPIFWKLHGWVDDGIEAWFAAHESAHPGQVKRKTVRGIAWFEQGPWVLKADPFDWPGADEAHGGHHGHHGSGELETLEKVMALLKEIAERPAPGGRVDFRRRQDRALPGFVRHLQLNEDQS